MAKVISSLLVGLGFDVDQKGAKEFEGSIDSVKSKALQLGSVVAGGFGLKALTADFASSRDMLGKFADTFGVLPNDVMAFGNALATEQGSLEGFMSQLENLERVRARILVGDVGFFAPAAKAGIDPNVIANAENATDAYLALADSFSTMTTQQRINAAEALGLDEASIRLLSKGREGVDQLVERFRTIRPVTESSTEAAAEFNRQWVEFGQNIGSATDSVSDQFLPVVNSAIDGINNWIGVNKDLVNSNAVTFAGFSALVAGTGTLNTLAALARYIPAIGAGLATVATVAATLTGVGAAALTGVGIGSIINDNLSDDYKLDLGRGIAQTLAMFGNEEAQAALDAEAAAGGFTDTYQKQVEAGYFGNDSAPVRSLSESGFAERRREGIESVTQPQARQAPTRQTIEIPIMLDGAVIDRKVVSVVDGMAQTAIDDLSSSTGG